MNNHSSYQNPLCTRYASKEMQSVFSEDNKFKTWRKLWIVLAESEQALGIAITDAQIAELKAYAEEINYSVAQEKEKEVRHDVMAHVYAYGAQATSAKSILHLGATSCYVGDNTDLLLMQQAMTLVHKKLISTIAALRDFCMTYKSQPTLAYTHFQAAQPTTVGKRATLWLNELLMDLEDLEHQMRALKFRGCRGTTGTGASFLELFEGDHKKVKELERMVTEKMGFGESYAVTGQTYSRKVDYRILSVLSGIAQSASKFSNDIRLLSHLKEVDEPFESGQIGSSAMAYKRNPMRSERITSLARYVIIDVLNPAFTAATQWFERTLDDSANKRISIPEAFLSVDAILSLYINIIGGMRIYPKIIEKHLQEELPFMATETILMHCTKKGGDRQELHEAIRKHSVAAAEQIKLHGKENDLLDRIVKDPLFCLTEAELSELLTFDKYIGRAKEQTEEFITQDVDPILRKYQKQVDLSVEITV